MTKVTITRKRKNIVKIEIEGHSGYGTSGNDIVCAAISALGQFIVTGIEEIIELEGMCHIDQNGAIKIDITELFQSEFKKIYFDNEISQCQLFFKTFEISSKEIAEQYPENVEVVVC